MACHAPTSDDGCKVSASRGPGQIRSLRPHLVCLVEES